MERYCLALDLKDDPQLISEYEFWHRNIWPEIVESIKKAGVTNMEIYRLNNRLFMIMETDDTFSFERKANLDRENSKVQEWEEIMWRFQQSLPGGKVGEKWQLMDKIFKL